jgi:protein TonB
MRRLTLRWTLLISLAVHAALVGAWFALVSWTRTEPPPHRATLAFDMIGIVAARQQDAQTRAAPPPPAAPPAEPPPQAPPRQRNKAAMPVRSPKAAPPAAAPPQQVEKTVPSENVVEDGENRVAKRMAVSQDELEEALKRQYANEIVRRVRANLRYPMAAKIAGETGYPVVSFTVTTDGGIRALEIARSCGHASLDEAGLAAVRRTTLPPPPKEMEIRVELSFEREEG